MNIVLIGFMGTGKTAVGHEVSQQLQRKFVDTDAKIATLAGKEISEIFAEDGQSAFRDMEQEVCRELGAKQDLVIATGGGTLIDRKNRELLSRNSIVICLTATEEEVVRRLSGTDPSARPLLGDDLEATITELLADRRFAYDSFPWRVDTTSLTVEAAAQRVIEIADNRTIEVRYPGGDYEIRIGVGLLSDLGEILKGQVTGRVAVVTNTVVGPLYAAATEGSLRGIGLVPFTCTIPDGEPHKRLATVEHLYKKFLAGGLDRGGTVISLGGGVTGDIAGFAAATYMRGVDFIQIPTTLLAMIDASVGGKTGVDLPEGKNLIGAFKFPRLVLIDPRVLATLPDEEVKNGAAEAIKHGIIANPDLFERLCNGPLPFTPGMIDRILRVKIRIVEEDPYELGHREVLNLGHTVGHAIERASGFTVPHGAAVAIGLVAAARIAVQLSCADDDLVTRVESALSAWDLPTKMPDLAIEEIVRGLARDKKRKEGRIRFVLPTKIGRVEITSDVSAEMIAAVLQRMRRRS